jgi:hypothetical protein
MESRKSPAGNPFVRARCSRLPAASSLHTRTLLFRAMDAAKPDLQPSACSIHAAGGNALLVEDPLLWQAEPRPPPASLSAPVLGPCSPKTPVGEWFLACQCCSLESNCEYPPES